MLSIQLLVSTMNQTDFSLIEKMNIQTNAVIINQCDHYEYHELTRNKHTIKWFNVKEKGLSRSRNVALSKATGDICLLVDDDEVMKNGYAEVILSEFEKNPKVGLITFNLNSIGNISNRYINKERKRLRFYNIMRYGSARIAFKRSLVVNKRLCFAADFGAGAPISCGEDSLFLYDCLQKGIIAYSSPEFIADIDDGDGNSSWFRGYTEKYFTDLGAVYAAMSPRFSYLWILQFLIRHKTKTSKLGFYNCLSLMVKGKRIYNSNMIDEVENDDNSVNSNI
jgi:glycosyltransferase involved in cell wall biosynthesis